MVIGTPARLRTATPHLVISVLDGSLDFVYVTHVLLDTPKRPASIGLVLWGSIAALCVFTDPHHRACAFGFTVKA